MRNREIINKDEEMGTDGICILVLTTARLSEISGPTYKSLSVSTNTQGNRDTHIISELQSLGVAGAEYKIKLPTPPNI